jgi:ATP-dependent DNA helicase DinG
MVDINYIHEVFPHRGADGKPSYRRHQFEVIRDALLAFESGVETVVIEAPTGSGKTDIAKAVALYATRGFAEASSRASRALDPAPILADSQAHMITSMKLLQDAYLKSRGHVVLLKGKNNYACAHDPRDTVSLLQASIGDAPSDFTCADAESFFGGRGCGSKQCSFQQAKHAAANSPLALHNFESFLNQVVLGKAFPYQRALITVDEAHNVEDKIINFAAVEITSSVIKSMGLTWSPLTSESEVGPWLAELRARVARVTEDARIELSNMRVTFRGLNIGAGEKKLRRLSWIVKNGEDIINRSQRYFMSIESKAKPMKWVVDHDAEGVRIEPVQGGRFVREALMKWGRKQLLLSATFLDGAGAYSKALRLKTESTARFTVPSTFAADRRPIIRRYVGDLGHRGFDENSVALAREIEKICSENSGVRGVVHCTSYGMSEWLRTTLADAGKRMVWHGKEDRESVVKSFMASKNKADAVLVGVGLTEGYDFAGDLCRFQILIRTPYPYPSKRLKARSEVDPQHMDWRACLTIVQTYGRGMRSADDYCRTYVLDRRFDRFVKKNAKQLPAWFTEAII